MKSFLIGMAGALLVLVAAAIIFPAYSDYTDRAITYEMLASIKPIQESIESQLINQLPIAIDVSKYKLTRHIGKIIISTSGNITVQGGKAGQIIILTPTTSANKVTWQCMGGNYHAMPPLCKNT